MLVEDTIVNLKREELGVAFDNHVTVSTSHGIPLRPECTPRKWCKHYEAALSPCIHVAGLREELRMSWTNSYTAENPAFNPTIYRWGIRNDPD